MRRQAFQWLTILLGAFPCGCGAPRQGTAQAVSPAAQQPAAGVDLARAATPLEKIPDPPSRPASAEVAPLSERAAKQVAAARSLIGEERFTEAALELERALRFEPNHPEIQKALALLHWQAGNTERARLHARKAVEGNPDSILVHYILGRCAVKADDRGEAIREFRTALLCSDARSQPDVLLLIYFHLGESLVAAGYLEAALQCFQEFERLAKTVEKPALPEAQMLLQVTRGLAGEQKARALEQLGRLSEAADALLPLVKASPANPQRTRKLAELYVGSGRFDDALSFLSTLNPDDPDVFEQLLDVYNKSGRPERVIEELKRRLQTDPANAEWTLRLASALNSMNRKDEAIRELKTFLRSHADAGAKVRETLLELLLETSQWADALQLTTESIALDMTQADELATTLIQAAKKSGSLDALTRAADQQAGTFADAFLRAMLAIEMGKPIEASGQLQASIDLRPDFLAARAALARLYLDQYRYDDALRVSEVPDNVVTTPAIERVRGQVYERLDDLEKAENHLRRATQLDRADTESMMLLAQIYRRSNRTLQAQRQLRVLLDQNRTHEAAREMLATMYIAEGKLDAAVEEIEELRRISTNPCTIARCNTFLDLELRQDAQARRRVLLKCAQSGAADVSTWLAIAETYEQDEEVDEVRAAYLKALQLDPDNEDAALGLVQADQRALNFEDAALRLAMLLERRPNRHEWRLRLILLNRVINEFDRALRLAQEQLHRADLEPAMLLQYQRAVADIYDHAGRKDELLAYLKQMVQLEQDQQEWLRRLVEACVSAGKFDDAVDAAEQLLSAAGRDIRSRALLIETLTAAKRFDRALQYTLDWFEEDPENDQHVELLASAMALAKHLDDAIVLVRDRLTRTENREDLQNWIIRALSRDKRHEESVSYIESLIDECTSLLRTMGEGGRRLGDKPALEQIARRPDDPSSMQKIHQRSLQLRGWMLSEMISAGRVRDAETGIAAWLEQETDQDQRYRLLQLLANCHRVLGNSDKVLELTEQAFALASPRNVTPHNDLAYMWIDRGIRLKEAEPLIRYAISRFPLQAAYLDTYAWLLYKRGDFSGAYAWLMRAYHALERKDPVIYDHLGDTAWRLGKKDEAISHWQKAVELASERADETLLNDDEKRVRSVTPRKIELANSGGDPPVAELGQFQPSD